MLGAKAAVNHNHNHIFTYADHECRALSSAEETCNIEKFAIISSLHMTKHHDKNCTLRKRLKSNKDLNAVLKIKSRD